ncbi:fimbrial protein [Acinetobacter sp. AS167]|jgi:major type 1 subunit fimbrin (pilin)|uniref:fimbrial protein n=1 Tax=Acinetobacter sp. AS167 TaxID=3127884 RepID=UPI003016AB4A
MKKLTLPPLAIWALLLVSGHVFAVDGKITVNGVVVDQTCTLQAYNVMASGKKDLTMHLQDVPKSGFAPSTPQQAGAYFFAKLTNSAGGKCDAATTKAFKGIHLSAISATDLDETDKTLLVNQAIGASATNPIFIRLTTWQGAAVDLSAPWGTQAYSPATTPIPQQDTIINYLVTYVSKTGIVDAQSVTATVNYNIHYN